MGVFLGLDFCLLAPPKQRSFLAISDENISFKYQATGSTIIHKIFGTKSRFHVKYLTTGKVHKIFILGGEISTMQ